MTQHISRHHARSAGLSLIELMIAMVIGVLLLLGLVQTMSASRAAYQLSAGVARTQENARFAMDYLQRDLRMAGHLGCVNDQARMQPNAEGVNLLFMTDAQRLAGNYPAGPFAGRFDMGIQGFEATGTAPNQGVNLPSGDPAVAANANSWSPALPGTLFNDIEPVAGSDIIVMRYFSPVGASLASFVANGTATSTVTPEPALADVTTSAQATGLFGVSDCTHASVFAGAVDAGTGAVTVNSGAAELNKSNFSGEEIYQPSQAVLYRAEAVVYYVGIGASGEDPALFRARFESNGAGGFNTASEELVEGVESLQLLYGGDDQTDPALRPTGYISRSNVASAIGGGVANPSNLQATDWRRVGSVQIGLLMRSSDRAAAQQADADINALSVLDVQMTAPQDGYYRSVYENTVALRNRLFGN